MSFKIKRKKVSYIKTSVKAENAAVTCSVLTTVP